MAKDKYSAVWVSHSSIADYLRCPRAYYLRAVYKDPKTGHKITHMQPPLALGQVIHDVIDSLSVLPVENRLDVSLVKKFETAWENISGRKGGFKSLAEEEEYKQRGREMLKRLEENPGPIVNKAVKIKTEDGLPYYWFNEEDNIILCGKIDWLEYIQDEDAVHIIDFKTGKNEEPEDSLQLPIYYLLAKNTQTRSIAKASYWYLENGDGPVEQKLPDEKTAYDKIYEVAKRIKLARQINHFKCEKEGCFACRPLEKILKGEGEKVGISEYNQDIYIL